MYCACLLACSGWSTPRRAGSSHSIPPSPLPTPPPLPPPTPSPLSPAQALSSDTAPADLIQTLLNLSEYMDHIDRALPISFRVLGAAAEKCHAFAKACLSIARTRTHARSPLTRLIRSLGIRTHSLTLESAGAVEDPHACLYNRVRRRLSSQSPLDAIYLRRDMSSSTTPRHLTPGGSCDHFERGRHLTSLRSYPPPPRHSNRHCVTRSSSFTCSRMRSCNAARVRPQARIATPSSAHR